MSCLVLDVPVEAVRSLPAEPGSLDGLPVAVRWQPGGHHAADSTLDAAFERLTAAGARAGIVVADQPSDRAAADALLQRARGARFALIDPPAGPDLAARIFAVRSLVTALRAARPDIEIAVEPDAFERADFPLDRLDRS